VNRIAVIGCSGAGKTELSRRLGEKLGLPVIHLDHLGWQPGWQKVPHDELVRRQEAAFTREGRWIADGNWAGTMMLRLTAADTIVFLDLPMRTCLYRVLARRLRRPEVAPGCRERWLDREFPGFLRFIAMYRRVHRPRMLARLAALDGGQRVITLRSPREVEDFVSAL